LLSFVPLSAPAIDFSVSLLMEGSAERTANGLPFLVIMNLLTKGSSFSISPNFRRRSLIGMVLIALLKKFTLLLYC